jgi:pimeloyl-ACP methyl ester carboxylesterase
MKILLIFINLFLFGYPLTAQDDCLPKYDMPVKTIQLSTGKLAYVESGKGRTIIFIHGLGANLSHWLKVVHELSASYHCIAVDLPGYGWSQREVNTNGEDHIQFYAEAMNEFIKKKKIKAPFVAGHSMGGHVAIVMALQNKTIRKLMLVAPGGGLENYSETERQSIVNSLSIAYFEDQDETAIRSNLKRVFYKEPADAEQLAQYRIQMRNCSNFKLYCENVMLGVKGAMQHTVRDSLKFLKMPVLLVYGEEDAAIPNPKLRPNEKTQDVAKDAAALIPDCKLVMIPEAGHMVLYEKNKELCAAIRNFLN